MKLKNPWSIPALFVIALMLSLPFISANALAQTVQITKNQGEENIRGFLDAAGDTWTVEATISGVAAADVEPAEVTLDIGGNQAPFQSCSDAPLGAACQYVSPISGIAEGQYAFTARYDYTDSFGVPASASASDAIRVDGSAPRVTISSVSQQLRSGSSQQGVRMDFTATDRTPANSPAIGIKTIEVIDTSDNSVLQRIELPDAGVLDYNFAERTGGFVEASFSGEGRRAFKVRAYDWLGHSGSGVSSPVETDFVPPQVHSLVEFPDLGEFIGQSQVTSAMSADIIERNLNENEVRASSENAELRNTPASSCLPDEETDNLWHCTWESVRVSPAASISVTIDAKDEKGNSASRTLSKSFTVDSEPPVVEFFGTLQTFEGRSYVGGSREHSVYLVASDSGAGFGEQTEQVEMFGGETRTVTLVDAKRITANLRGIGGSEVQAPDQCVLRAGTNTIECIWETARVFTSAGVARIGLASFSDRVGNEGERPQAELIIDTSGPIVEELEVTGVGPAGEHDYFQSNDVMKIKLTIIETSGAAILVDLRRLVQDAETIFPAQGLTASLGDGWMALTQEQACQRVEGKWECVVDTPPLKSGPSTERLQVIVQDTAGNEAVRWPETVENVLSGSDGDYQISLLGLSVEEAPDYWEVNPRGTRSLLPFVDLDTTHLIPVRVPVQIDLDTDAGNVQLIGLNLVECTAGPLPGTAEFVPGASPSGRGAPAGLAIFTRTSTATEKEGVAPLRALAGRAAHQETPRRQETTPEAVPVGTPGSAAEEALAEGEATGNLPTEAPPEVRIRRSLVISGVSAEGDSDPSPKILLELEPFDAKDAFKEIMEQMPIDENGRINPTAGQVVKVPVTCQLQLFSQVGSNALQFAENQEVSFTVPFGFSALGAVDENLEDKVNSIKDEVLFTIADKIQIINKVIQWAQWLAGLVSLVTNIEIIWNIVTAGYEPLYVAKITSPIGIAGCAKATTTEQLLTQSVSAIQIPLAILSCNPQGANENDVLLGPYGQFQRAGIGLYNIVSGRALLGLQATSAYENIWASIISVCPPGILFNLEKYRQVRCREIICLQKEVPSGLATPQSCAQLGEYLECRYWKGNALTTLTPLHLASNIAQFIQGWFTSPLGFVRAALHIPCIVTCAASGAGAAICSTSAVLIRFGDIIDTLAGIWPSRPSVTGDPYCSQIE